LEFSLYVIISLEIQFFAHNRNVGYKSKLCPKTEIEAKNENSGQNFGQQLKFLTTIEIFDNN